MSHLIYLAAIAVVVALAIYQVSTYFNKKNSIKTPVVVAPVAPATVVAPAPVPEVLPTTGVVIAFLNSIENLAPEEKVAQIAAKIDDLESLATAMPHHASFANSIIESLKSELAKI